MVSIITRSSRRGLGSNYRDHAFSEPRFLAQSDASDEQHFNLKPVCLVTPNGLVLESDNEDAPTAFSCFPCRKLKTRRKAPVKRIKDTSKTNLLLCHSEQGAVYRRRTDMRYVDTFSSPVEPPEEIGEEPPLAVAPRPPAMLTPGPPPLPPRRLSRVGADVTTRSADVHSQVEYQHHLVPNLSDVFAMPFYWGVMDRYEAEAVLEDRPEGSFLLRDSAQDNFVFSVSFRRFGRTLHARVEHRDHLFTFDSHDANIFAADTVKALLEYYLFPGNCMFYEPMCCVPVVRSRVFSLQELCRASICSETSYDGLADLKLPRKLVQYLRYYHYKIPIRYSYFAA